MSMHVVTLLTQHSTFLMLSLRDSKFLRISTSYFIYTPWDQFKIVSSQSLHVFLKQSCSFPFTALHGILGFFNFYSSYKLWMNVYFFQKLNIIDHVLLESKFGILIYSYRNTLHVTILIFMNFTYVQSLNLFSREYSIRQNTLTIL